MTEDTSRDASRHQTLAAYRAAGGDPAEHPDLDTLLQVAGFDRWVHPDEIKTRLGRIPAAERTPVEAWSVELLGDDELAEWFLDGLPPDVVEQQESAARREWDVLHRPWKAELVVRREGFRCDITGRGDGTVGILLSPRLDEDREPILLHLDEVVALGQRSLAAVEEAVTLAERMGPGRQQRLEQRLAELGTAPQDIGRPSVFVDDEDPA